MYFTTNDIIGKYTIKFPHKQGAYAETYRVKDAIGKTRFLKLINYSKLSREQLDHNGKVIEIEIAKQLHHHNLCQYIDSGSIMLGGAQYAWFVTEFVSGETLAERIIRDGTINVYEIKTIAKAVLSALSFLHTQQVPIIHNEVTIQNIFINLVGNLQDIKLIDFGHARFLNMPPSKPYINELNPFYLAPERFNGVCSVQTDIYAVGVMIYHLLYGQLPWFVDLSRVKDNDKTDRILAERSKELSFPDVDIYELDEQLQNIIAKALCYDAEDRFQTADEFIDAIDGNVKIERLSTKTKRLSMNTEKALKNKNQLQKGGEGFAAIAGMDELKQKMKEEIINPLLHPEEYMRYGITIPNGMLLYGPPGCGKTFFAKHFAEEVGFNFMLNTPASLQSKYINETQENIKQMFNDAIENAPTIIFIDEINELVPNRNGSNMSQMAISAVNEMLAQMDRTGEKGVFVIGATNAPNLMDPAVLRAGRFDLKYYIGTPDMAARVALFKLYLKNRPYDFGLDYEKLARMTNNYVSADIKLIVNNASLMALKQHSKITMELLETSIKASLPSLSIEELKRYDNIKAEMEHIKTAPPKQGKIGFN